MANLVARSLAVADQTATDTRYGLLETIRQYAQERLGDSDEAESLGCRYADYFIQFAATATPRVFGPGEIEWARHIAMEHDNYHAAMSFALQRQDLDRVTGLICELPTHEYQMERLIVFDPEPVLSLPGASDHPGLVRVLWEAADRASAVNDFARSQSYLQKAEAAVCRLGPSPGYLDAITLNMTLHRDISQDGDLLAAQTRDPSPLSAIAGQSGLLGADPGPPGAQEFPDLAAHAAAKVSVVAAGCHVINATGPLACLGVPASTPLAGSGTEAGHLIWWTRHRE